jgi:hypothetical protein
MRVIAVFALAGASSGFALPVGGVGGAGLVKPPVSISVDQMRIGRAGR